MTTRGPKRPAIKAQVKLLARACEDCGVSSSARLLLVALYSYSDEHGRCWPSNALLEKDTGLSDRTIRKVIPELEKAGLLRSFKPSKDANGAKGRAIIGAVKLPRGQSIYYVWPTASAFGRSDYVQAVNPKGRVEDLEQAVWFAAMKPGEKAAGPFKTAEVEDQIRRGIVTGAHKLWTTTAEWHRAIDFPAFAGLFDRAV